MFKVSKRTLLDLIIIAVVSLLSSLSLIFLFNLFPPKNYETHVPHGFNEVLERNYDGPIYAILAKTNYDPKLLTELNFNDLPPKYYANHFPVYPIIIKLGYLLTGNYLRSMIVTNWLSAIVVTYLLYFFLKNRKVKHILALSVLSLFIPPRWFAVRSVGANEGIFMIVFILAFYFWERKKFFWASVCGLIAVLCRTPGILLFPTFLLMAYYQKIEIRKLWSTLILPLGLLLLFVFFYYNFGDFFAYFHTGTGTNVNLQWVPFAAVLGYIGPVPEGYLYMYMIYAIGLYLLWQKKEKLLTIFCGVYFLFTVFLFVDDVWRYLIPISPFVLIYGYKDIITKKMFYVLFAILLVGIYIYTFSLLPYRIFNYDSYARIRAQKLF